MLPAPPPVGNAQLVHLRPERIGVKPQELGSSSRPVDLAAGRRQSLPDVLYRHLVPRKRGLVSACFTSPFMISRNLRRQKALK